MVYIWRVSTDRGTLLVRESDLGAHDAPAPRDLPAPSGVIRWGGPLLMPLSSAMRVCTTERVIGLTYDDGPHPEGTVEILDALDERDVRATFFLLAEAAERYPDLVQRILRGGHEIGLHGVDHARLTAGSAAAAARAVATGKRRLERVTGSRVRMYRPTYGAQGLLQFLTSRALGMDVVYWSAWAEDWFEDEAVRVAARAVAARHPGAILLLHDSTEDTDPDVVEPTFSRGEVTRRVLDGLFEDGYRVVPAGALLAEHRPVRAVTTQRPWVTARRRASALSRRSTPPT